MDYFALIRAFIPSMCEEARGSGAPGPTQAEAKDGLTEDEVRAIRNLWKAGWDTRDLARVYAVDVDVILALVLGLRRLPEPR